MADYFDRFLYDYAMSFLLKPYKWGGDDFSGIDCSGFVIELMQSCGQLPHKSDMTAQGLFNLFEAGKAIYSTASRFGSLVFYGESVTRITHVAFALDQYRILEAGGGGSKVNSVEDAIKYNAFVRMRPIDYRDDRVAILKPFYRSIGAV